MPHTALAPRAPQQGPAGAHERAKMSRVLSLLPRERYRLALALGCASTRLADRLGERAGRVVATDTGPAALEAVRRSISGLAGLPPHGRRDATPDLVLVSEVLADLPPGGIEALGRRIDAAAAPSADIVIVSRCSSSGGDGSAERLLLRALGAAWRWSGGTRQARYAVSVLSRGTSVRVRPANDHLAANGTGGAAARPPCNSRMQLGSQVRRPE